MIKKADKAKIVADQFLNQVDGYDFSGSYDLTSIQVQALISRDDWISKLNAFRKTLGKCKSRELISSSTSTSLEGLPDGQYFTFVYSSTFVAKEKSEETIIISLNEKGFKVMGYNIK